MTTQTTPANYRPPISTMPANGTTRMLRWRVTPARHNLGTTTYAWSHISDGMTAALQKHADHNEAMVRHRHQAATTSTTATTTNQHCDSMNAQATPEKGHHTIDRHLRPLAQY